MITQRLILDGPYPDGVWAWAMARKMHPDTGAPRADWDRLDEARRMLTAAKMM